MSKAQLPKRNYNIFALQGDDTTDDMDVVETLGLDPQVAYTPDINIQAINKMEQENVQYYQSLGMPEKKAKDIAHEAAQATKASINALMRDQRIDFQM